MSPSGHKRTYAVQIGMSALPLKADMCGATPACPLCANSGHLHLFDNSVRLNLDHVRNFEP